MDFPSMYGIDYNDEDPLNKMPEKFLPEDKKSEDFIIPVPRGDSRPMIDDENDIKVTVPNEPPVTTTVNSPIVTTAMTSILLTSTQVVNQESCNCDRADRILNDEMIILIGCALTGLLCKSYIHENNIFNDNIRYLMMLYTSEFNSILCCY